MAYADQDDIEGEMQGVTFPLAPVTVAVLTDYLDQESAIIDNFIGNHYTTPVTADAYALNVLKKICIDLVVYRVIKVLGRNTTDAEGRDVSPEYTSYKNSMKLLMRIGDGDANLQGAERLSTKSNRMYISPVESTTDRVFLKDTQQW